MVVVIPDTHALDPDQVPRTQVGHYLNENVQAEDRELFEDIIPFVTAHYRVKTDAKDRALAGLSMGGYQTVYTGFVHPDQFFALGVFSAGIAGNVRETRLAERTFVLVLVVVLVLDWNV